MVTKNGKPATQPVRSAGAKSSGVVLLKAGSQDFRTPVRLGKDTCGYQLAAVRDVLQATRLQDIFLEKSVSHEVQVE